MEKILKTQGHLIHLIPTHSRGFLSHFVSNISSARVSTTVFSRQIPRPQGLSLKWQSMLPPVFYNPRFFHCLLYEFLLFPVSVPFNACTSVWCPSLKPDVDLDATAYLFQALYKVGSEAFASKGAHLSSVKLAWLWPRAAGADRGCHVAWNHSEHRQAPLMYLYRRKVHVHLPSTWSQMPVQSEKRGKTATGRGDMPLRSLSLAKFREHSTQALPLKCASSE